MGCRDEAVTKPVCSGQKSTVLLPSSSRQIGKFSSRSREEDGRRTGGFFDQGIRQVLLYVSFKLGYPMKSFSKDIVLVE